MTRLLALLVALTFCLGAAPAAAEALLRPRVLVEGDSVTVGDLFDNVGDKASVAVLRAPPPGQRTTVDNDWLTHVAVINGISWHPRGLFEEAVIERAGVVVSHEQIEASLMDVLLQKGAAPDSLIETDLGGRQMMIPVGTMPIIVIRDLVYDHEGDRFGATITLSNSGSNDTRSMLVSGHLYPTVQMPVLSRPLGRGDQIASRDITWIKLRRDALRSTMIDDPDLIVGMSAKQPLRAGRPLSIGDLQKSLVVLRGATVTLLLNYRGMELIAQGRAVDQGAIGETVHVVNTHSNITIEGTVTGTNTVRVSLNGPLASAN